MLVAAVAAVQILVIMAAIILALPLVEVLAVGKIEIQQVEELADFGQTVPLVLGRLLLHLMFQATVVGLCQSAGSIHKVQMEGSLAAAEVVHYICQDAMVVLQAEEEELHSL